MNCLYLMHPLPPLEKYIKVHIVDIYCYVTLLHFLSVCLFFLLFLCIYLLYFNKYLFIWNIGSLPFVGVLGHLRRWRLLLLILDFCAPPPWNGGTFRFVLVCPYVLCDKGGKVGHLCPMDTFLVILEFLIGLLLDISQYLILMYFNLMEVKVIMYFNLMEIKVIMYFNLMEVKVIMYFNLMEVKVI